MDMELTEPLNVIYQSTEDGLADTVKPRLEQAERANKRPKCAFEMGR